MLLQIAGRDAVGRDHEILDQLLGPVLFAQTQIDHPAIVEHSFGLDCFQIERSVQIANRAHELGRLVLHSQLLVEPLDLANLRRASWPWPSSHAATLGYASLALLLTIAR